MAATILRDEQRAAGDVLAALAAIVGPAHLIAGDAAPERYTTDWHGELKGRPRAVIRPAGTTEVAAAMAACARHGCPVTVQGGHTGLVGGATPSADGSEVVFSLERMQQIREVDPISFTLTAEAGCVLAKLQEAAALADRFFPLSLGAEGSCQIGGNIATNAGGINVLRYGMARDLVLGLEVVLPDGQVWNGLKKLRKDNRGYDLKQLFIGAEGTLGIVTAAVLKLFPRPIASETAFLAVPDVQAAMKLFAAARADLGDLCSAFELLSRDGLEMALAVMADGRDPLEQAAPHYVLIECATSARLDLRALIEDYLGRMLEAGLVTDGTLAASRAQAATFWRIREAIVEAQARYGVHLRTDVSVPLADLPVFIDRAIAAVRGLAPAARPLAYGHVGDGNIHLNVLPPEGMAAAARHDLLKAAEAAIFEVVDAMNGSISAEHGIGLLKREALAARATPLEQRLGLGLKQVLDPGGLMSPGRILARP